MRKNSFGEMRWRVSNSVAPEPCRRKPRKTVCIGNASHRARQSIDSRSALQISLAQLMRLLLALSNAPLFQWVDRSLASVRLTDFFEFSECIVLSITNTATTRMLLKSTLLSFCAVVMINCQLTALHASCGDYLSEHGMPSHEHDLPVGPAEIDQSGANPKQPLQPCSGPLCRQREELPIGPSTPVVFPSASDMVLVAVTTLDAEVYGFELHLGGSTVLQETEIGRVFKPPKPVKFSSSLSVNRPHCES